MPPAAIRDERGSLPLALLATIVVAGLVTVLVARTIAGRESTRSDRDFTDALHVADAGVQAAMVYLNQHSLLDAGFDQLAPDGVVDGRYVSTVDGRTYTVTWSGSGSDWEITSVSEVDGVDREVVAAAEEKPLFSHALYAKRGIAFSGANTTDSYNATTWCTRRGYVGTDGALEFTGLAPAGSCHESYKKVTVDQSFLYDCGDLAVAACEASTTTAGEPRCEHAGGENCTFPPTYPKGPLDAVSEPFRLTPESELQKIIDETAVCEAAGWNDTTPSVTQSTGGVWVTANGNTIPAYTGAGRDFWCVTSLKFGGDTTVTRGASGQPVRIYVKGGTIEVAGTGTRVNCPGCTHTNYRATRPDAGALIVVSLGASTFRIADPQVQLAAGVYAPNAICDGPAGADIYGAAVCEIVDNVGNWNFHYDERLGDAGATGVFGIASYREELG
ncbi:MAG TPA: hypothetical protein VHF25_05820 [Nitriliruptorales bacterium]|nr:hypothetical protein [Nitriliruptorales bacterium]